MSKKKAENENLSQTPKPKKKITLGRRLAAFFFTGIIIYAIVTLITQQTSIDASKKVNEQLSAKIEVLGREITFYERKRDQLLTDDYIEQIAREKLGWVKDGETIFKVE